MGLNREGWGGGSYFKSHIFEEIDNNFPFFTITPVTQTEQEIGFVSPFYKMQIHLFSSGNKDQVSIESD